MIIYLLICILICILFFSFDQFGEVGQKYRNIFVHFLVQMKASISHSVKLTDLYVHHNFPQFMNENVPFVTHGKFKMQSLLLCSMLVLYFCIYLNGKKLVQNKCSWSKPNLTPKINTWYNNRFSIILADTPFLNSHVKKTEIKNLIIFLILIFQVCTISWCISF